LNTDDKSLIPLVIVAMGRSEVGETLKVLIVERTWTGFLGHSLLVKKTANDTYCYFDPKEGEYRNLSPKKLCEHIDRAIRSFCANDIFFMKAETFLEKLSARQSDSPSFWG
jgi:hypothetical protein